MSRISVLDKPWELSPFNVVITEQPGRQPPLKPQRRGTDGSGSGSGSGVRAMPDGLTEEEQEQWKGMEYWREVRRQRRIEMGVHPDGLPEEKKKKKEKKEKKTDDGEGEGDVDRGRIVVGERDLRGELREGKARGKRPSVWSCCCACCQLCSNC